MLGDCKGPIVLPSARTIRGVTVTYAQSGIGSINLILDNLSLITLGDTSQAISTDPEVEKTTWLFVDDTGVPLEKFVGFTAWQTSSVIRSLAVITMNQACANEAIRKAEESAKSGNENENTDSMVIDAEIGSQDQQEKTEKESGGISSAVLILIILGGAMVLLSSFLCCIYCRKNKHDQKKEKATVIPDSSIDKTIESKKTFDEVKHEKNNKFKPRINV